MNKSKITSIGSFSFIFRLFFFCFFHSFFPPISSLTFPLSPPPLSLTFSTSSFLSFTPFHMFYTSLIFLAMPNVRLFFLRFFFFSHSLTHSSITLLSLCQYFQSFPPCLSVIRVSFYFISHDHPLYSSLYFFTLSFAFPSRH